MGAASTYGTDKQMDCAPGLLRFCGNRSLAGELGVCRRVDDGRQLGLRRVLDVGRPHAEQRHAGGLPSAWARTWLVRDAATRRVPQARSPQQRDKDQ